MESRYVNDPLGSVTFDIYREGTDGVVNVQWRLSADAAADFEAPLTGTKTFGPVSSKALSIDCVTMIKVSHCWKRRKFLSVRN